MTRAFAHFCAIDWSGAVGERQRGIAVAMCDSGRNAPVLVRPDHIWSRGEILAWLRDELPGDTLVGLDIGSSLPFADVGAFFPGWDDTPSDARALWALVDAICVDDAHLAATSFVDHAHASRHFRRHGGRTGDLYPAGRGRLRISERGQGEQGLNPYSNLNLVGAAQVGKSSLTGMRVLHQLGATLPVWPYDPVPATGSLVVEIYTSIAARDAGLPKGRSKVRDAATLDAALVALGSAPPALLARYDDHATDAMMGAAWLRIAASDPGLWAPVGLTPELACTEGWTFGVR